MNNVVSISDVRLKRISAGQKDSIKWVIGVFPDKSGCDIHCSAESVIIYAERLDQLPHLIDEARRRMKPILVAGVRT